MLQEDMTVGARALGQECAKRVQASATRPMLRAKDELGVKTEEVAGANSYRATVGTLDVPSIGRTL